MWREWWLTAAGLTDAVWVWNVKCLCVCQRDIYRVLYIGWAMRIIAKEHHGFWKNSLDYAHYPFIL